jgi:membrane associated rhomboid family serine protease
MILPIGHEDGAVARAPRVTLGIVALCVLAHLWVVGHGDADRELERSWEEAVGFALEHPELSPPPGLVPEELVPVVAEARREGRGEPAPEHQRRLDELAARWQAARRAHPLFRHGLVPADPRPHALLAHLFLHAGWLHLLGNMLILWLSAPFLEEAWGRRRFTVFYLAAGLVAGTLYALQHRELDVPLIGASGAVAGIVAAYLMLHPWAHVTVLVFGLMTIRIHAYWLLGAWIAWQVANVLLMTASEVSYWSHLGGLIAGALLVLVLRRPGVPLFQRHFAHWP